MREQVTDCRNASVWPPGKPGQVSLHRCIEINPTGFDKDVGESFGH